MLVHLKTLPDAFKAGMEELVSLHPKTGVEKTGEYLTQEEDRQVGLACLVLPISLRCKGLRTLSSVKH